MVVKGTWAILFGKRVWKRISWSHIHHSWQSLLSTD